MTSSASNVELLLHLEMARCPHPQTQSKLPTVCAAWLTVDESWQSSASNRLMRRVSAQNVGATYKLA